MVWKWLRTVGKAILDVAKFGVPPKRYNSYKSDTALVVPENKVLVDRQEALQLAHLKLQYLQQQENIAFQAEQGRLSNEREKELQAFIQRAEDTRMEKAVDFQRWRLEQEKALEMELLERNQELQRELVTYQRQTSLKVVEEQKRLENSPIWLVASDILTSNPGEEQTPLRVFFSPPKLQFERFANVTNSPKGFPEIELTLAEGLRQFFRSYSNSGRNIDFLAGAWVSKSFHSEASIKALFGVLKSEPTLVLESEVDGDYLNFRVAYWGLNWSSYRYDPVISRLPYRDILYEAAKTRARKWTETREKLIAAGVNEQEVDQVYGQDNVKNWEILQREEKFREVGIDESDLELNYFVNKKDFEELCQFLIINHCVFAGLVADEYFLFQYNLPPLLPEVLPDLTQNVPDREVVQEMIQSVVLYYQNVYQALEYTRSSLVPDLALDLAESLAHLPNKSWAKQQIVTSIKFWLRRRGVAHDEKEQEIDNELALPSLLTTINLALKREDRDYVEKLNRCLIAVGEEKLPSVAEAYYTRAMECCNRKDYQGAITNFSVAIDVNPDWADAYYHRGVAYEILAQYQKAIADQNQALLMNPNWSDAYTHRGTAYYKMGDHSQALADYTQALEINPNSEETYNYRGNTYYKLKNYSQAIADYEQALMIDPKFPEALRNLDIVQGVFEEIKNKQERKRRVENFHVVQTLKGHSSWVTCVAIAPDGDTLVSGSDDKTIKVWQLSTGKKLNTLAGHTGSIYKVAIAPDGETLVSSGRDKMIKVWQLSTGKQTLSIDGHSGWVSALAISPDGEILVSGSGDNTIKVWQLSTGKELLTLSGHSGWVSALAISADGRTLFSGSGDKTVKVWQLSTGEELYTLRGHSSGVLSLAIAPDGKTLVSGSNDNTIKVWEIDTDKELRTFTGHSSWVSSLVMSVDGETVVSGSNDNTIKVWHMNTGREIKTFTGHTRSINCLALSLDGETLASSSADKTIKIWQVQ